MRLIDMLDVLSKREFIEIFYTDENGKDMVLWVGEAGKTTIYPRWYGSTVKRVSHIEAGIMIEVEKCEF